jgi:hypothetical protein
MIAQKSATSATSLIASGLVGNISATRKATKATLSLSQSRSKISFGRLIEI